MKKLIFILLCLPFVGFGQLGDFYKSNNHPKANGVDFVIKIPNGYEAQEGERDNTVQVFIKDKRPTISIHMYHYLKILPELSVHAKDKNSLKIFVNNIIETLKSEGKVEINAFNLGEYPGYILEEKTLMGTSHQLNLFLNHNLFVIGFTDKEISNVERDLLKKMANTLHFKHNLKN